MVFLIIHMLFQKGKYALITRLFLLSKFFIIVVNPRVSGLIYSTKTFKVVQYSITIEILLAQNKYISYSMINCQNLSIFFQCSLSVISGVNHWTMMSLYLGTSSLRSTSRSTSCCHSWALDSTIPGSVCMVICHSPMFLFSHLSIHSSFLIRYID